MATDSSIRKGSFIYFAYGSNMFSPRLKALERAPSAKAIGIGFVQSRRLTFDKVSTDGSGKCDIEQTSRISDRVYGVLYCISESERSKLDKAEGLSKGYDAETVEVSTSDGIIPADTYVATANKKDSAQKPYHWYKALVVAGANEHDLPQPYMVWLITVESKQDADAERRVARESLLYAATPKNGDDE
jgi:gamma-glutamylcyclotransferase